MKANSLYFIYGILLSALGISGFLLTHAKSALISGLASGLIMVVLSFFTANKTVALIAKIVNAVLLLAFSWRSFLVINAVANGNMSKLTPAILIGSMAVISLLILILSFRDLKSK